MKETQPAQLLAFPKLGVRKAEQRRFGFVHSTARLGCSMPFAYFEKTSHRAIRTMERICGGQVRTEGPCED